MSSIYLYRLCWRLPMRTSKGLMAAQHLPWYMKAEEWLYYAIQSSMSTEKRNVVLDSGGQHVKIIHTLRWDLSPLDYIFTFFFCSMQIYNRNEQQCTVGPRVIFFVLAYDMHFAEMMCEVGDPRLYKILYTCQKIPFLVFFFFFFLTSIFFKVLAMYTRLPLVELSSFHFQVRVFVDSREWSA